MSKTQAIDNLAMGLNGTQKSKKNSNNAPT